MSEVKKVFMICPYREPNEVYKWESREAREEEDSEVKILDVKSEYKLTRVPQQCFENLCAAWDADKHRCNRTE